MEEEFCLSQSIIYLQVQKIRSPGNYFLNYLNLSVYLWCIFFDYSTCSDSGWTSDMSIQKRKMPKLKFFQIFEIAFVENSRQQFVIVADKVINMMVGG